MPTPRRSTKGPSTLLAVLLLLASAVPTLAQDANSDKGSFTPLPPRVMLPGGTSGFRLPFGPGVDVRVSQGWMTKGSHKGPTSRYAYDFAVPMNTPVLAAAPGIVAFTRTGNTLCGGEKKTRFANVVTINHADGSATQYGHLTTVGVEVGQVVEAGQVIGRSGKTGNTGCEAHLHFARQLQGDLVTRSLPAYFKGYENKRFYAGSVVSGDRTCGGLLAARVDPEAATNGFCGAYFAGEFAGPALFWRRVDQLDLDRGTGTPGGYWLDAPQPYATRWTGRFDFAPWWYTFRVEASGAIRVTVDGAVLVEDWVDRENVRVFEVPMRTRDGVLDVKVERFTAYPGEHLEVDWEPLLIAG